MVSKLRSLDEVQAIYDQGHRKFAENRVQDLLEKQRVLAEDIEWHLIGTLQTNKVKYIAPFIRLIHAVDDLSLWKEIHRQGLKWNRIIPCLLQIKIGTEMTKNGFIWDDLCATLEHEEWKSLTNAPIFGVMGMATFTEDHGQVRKEFKLLKSYFDTLSQVYFFRPEFKIISMGMSGDYKLAIEEGSTMVRIGSLIFE